VRWNLSSPPEASSAGPGETLVIQEMRGDGVFDNVGGELWEASLLLCAYMLSHSDQFLQNSVLELGAGVGLCGLLAVQMKRRALSAPYSIPCAITTRAIGPEEVCFSDNDPQVLANLCSAIEVLVHDEAAGAALRAETGTPNATDAAVPVSVVHLDWTQSFPASLRDRFDIAIGSALCYSVGHSAALLRTIRSLLLGLASSADTPASSNTGSRQESALESRTRPRCREIVIVQISDRSGFQSLLQALDEDSELCVDVQKISQEMYAFAQLISCSAGTQKQQQQWQVQKQTQAHRHGQVTLQKKYHIPPWPPLPLKEAPSLPKGRKRGLLVTSKDNFRLVSITARV